MKSPISPLKLAEIIKSGQNRQGNLPIFKSSLNEGVKTPAESLFNTPDKTNIFKVSSIQ
jgi:hypothetical protein